MVARLIDAKAADEAKAVSVAAYWKSRPSETWGGFAVDLLPFLVFYNSFFFAPVMTSS